MAEAAPLSSWPLGEAGADLQTWRSGEDLARSPVGHYRVPTYLRGKTGSVETVIEPAGIDNEEEAYGRNAGSSVTTTASPSR